jgi:hypothetical protein
MRYAFIAGLGLALAVISSVLPAVVTAEEMAVADGKITLQMPEGWKKKQPKINIIEHECEIPSKEEGAPSGRMTIMGAGGSVEDNISRWKSQFEGNVKFDSKELTIANQKVHYVDLGGTFKDQPGPFAPAVKREGYRMLGAIIVTEKSGQYFVKFYGPQATVAANEDAFKKMIDGIKVK